MAGTPTRREILLASGVATGALSGCLSMVQGQPEECGPPGQYECPGDSELLAKIEFGGCSSTQVEGDCNISITDYETKENDDGEGGENCEVIAFDWDVDDDDCGVDSIRVYGGSDCEDQELDGATDGTVTTDLGAGQSEQQAAVSNVIFCGETTGEQTPEDTPEETPEDTPEETPEETPEDTPDDTPEETPEQTPDDTPEQTPEETPEDTPEETPEETPEKTPEKTPKETPQETPTDKDGDKKEKKKTKDHTEESPC